MGEPVDVDAGGGEGGGVNAGSICCERPFAGVTSSAQPRDSEVRSRRTKRC